MARQSAEGKAAAVWRAATSPPVAPAELSAAARRLWDAIVSDRPADQFRPGTQELLAHYCEMASLISAMMRAPPEDPAELARLQQMIGRQAMLAERLRLTPNAMMVSKSRQRDEREAPTGGLLGGRALKSSS